MAARNRNPSKMASNVVGLSLPAVRKLNTDVRAMLHAQIIEEQILAYPAASLPAVLPKALHAKGSHCKWYREVLPCTKSGLAFTSPGEPYKHIDFYCIPLKTLIDESRMSPTCLCRGSLAPGC